MVFISASKLHLLRNYAPFFFSLKKKGLSFQIYTNLKRITIEAVLGSIDDFGALIKELMQKTEDCLTVAKGFSTCILYSHTHTKQIHKKRFKELTSLDIIIVRPEKIDTIPSS